MHLPKLAVVGTVWRSMAFQGNIQKIMLFFFSRHKPLSKQRLVLFVIYFLNQFPELLKMVFDNIIQICINREFVNTHNIGKPVERFVVFLPYIDRFAPACRCRRDFKELSTVIFLGKLLWL